MQPHIWIGTIEVYYAHPGTPSVWEPALTTVTTWRVTQKNLAKNALACRQATDGSS
jgi:hypothetical protein